MISMEENGFSRRAFCKKIANGLGTGALLSFMGCLPKRMYPIGLCDWSLGLSGNPQALYFAKEMGFGGVQVSLGDLEQDLPLFSAERQTRFQQALTETGLQVCAFGLPLLNEFPLGDFSEARNWASKTIEIAQKWQVSTIMLPFFHHGDLLHNPSRQQGMIPPLRKLAKQAESAGIQLALESWLSAKDHITLIESVESPAIGVWYDVGNAAQMGYPIAEEIKLLGKENMLFGVHLKENNTLLGKGNIDFTSVIESLDQTNYEGWLVVEGSLPANADLRESCLQNIAFCQTLLERK
jgi:L-ribulose-5-phosphate 3-epimerase